MSGGGRPRPAPRLRSPAATLGPKASRTQAQILAQARQLFLERGYARTSVEDIAAASGISRTAFYAYFPSKQDVLVTLGQDAEQAGLAVARRLEQLPVGPSLAQLTAWVAAYLEFLDDYGAFIAATLQAAYEDEALRLWTAEIETAGARLVGDALRQLRGGTNPDGVEALTEGLALLALLERLWYRWRVAGAPLDPSSVAPTVAWMMWGALRP